MKKRGRYLKAKPKRFGTGRRILLIIVVLLLFLVAGGAAAGMLYYNSMLNLITRPETVATQREISDEEFEAILGYVPEKIETQATEAAVVETTAPKKKAEDQIINIMLIGQNYRKGEEHKLSDTLILCSLNKETKTLTLTSFLRDLYVKLPDYNGHICGKNRINVAYNLGWYWEDEMGGMAMLDMLMQENFGVEVDYNIEVGFESFKDIIDAIGGVEIELDRDEAYYISNDSEGIPTNRRTLQAGKNLLNGAEALSYSRMRHANAGDSDFNRTNRQRTVITQILNQCRSKSLPELNNLLKTILPYIITDMTNDEITKCALEVLPMLTDLKIVSNQCPAEGTYSFNMIQLGGYDAFIIECDMEKNKEMLLEIAEMPAE